MVGADNKGLSCSKISKKVKIDEEKVKNNEEFPCWGNS
jgi:hypothetical protein